MTKKEKKIKLKEVQNKFLINQIVVFDGLKARVDAIFRPLADRTTEKIAYSITTLHDDKASPSPVKESSLFVSQKEFDADVEKQERDKLAELKAKYE